MSNTPTLPPPQIMRAGMDVFRTPFIHEVTPENNRALHSTYQEVAEEMGIHHPPPLYLAISPIRNAFYMDKDIHEAEGIVYSLRYTMLPKERQRYVLAHELGHCLERRKMKPEDKKERTVDERRASELYADFKGIQTAGLEPFLEHYEDPPNVWLSASTALPVIGPMIVSGQQSWNGLKSVGAIISDIIDPHFSNRTRIEIGKALAKLDESIQPFCDLLEFHKAHPEVEVPEGAQKAMGMVASAVEPMCPLPPIRDAGETDSKRSR